MVTTVQKKDRNQRAPLPAKVPYHFQYETKFEPLLFGSASATNKSSAIHWLAVSDVRDDGIKRTCNPENIPEAKRS